MQVISQMPAFNKTSLWIGLFMICLSISAFVLRPSEKMSDQHKKIDIETMIPHAFGDWQEDKSANLLFVDPSVSQKVSETYLQSLSRTFVNAAGQRVMLAIAYGGDQNDMMQVHKPEICYTAQGFHIEEIHASSLKTDYGNFTVKEMVAVKGQRLEPVIYWVTIGNKIAVNPVQWRIERIRYGLTGVIPDGLLFRVSSLGNDIHSEYAVQRKFVVDLMQAITPEARSRILGISDVTF